MPSDAAIIQSGDFIVIAPRHLRAPLPGSKAWCHRRPARVALLRPGQRRPRLGQRDLPPDLASPGGRLTGMALSPARQRRRRGAPELCRIDAPIECGLRRPRQRSIATRRRDGVAEGHEMPEQRSQVVHASAGAGTVDVEHADHPAPYEQLCLPCRSPWVVTTAGADGSAEPSDQRLETLVPPRHDRFTARVAGGATQRTMRHADGRPDAVWRQMIGRSMSTAPSGAPIDGRPVTAEQHSRTVRPASAARTTIPSATSRPPRAPGRVGSARRAGRAAAPPAGGNDLEVPLERRRAGAALTHADTDDGAAPGPIGPRSSVTTSLGTPSRAATAGTGDRNAKTGQRRIRRVSKIPTARSPALTTSVPAGGPSMSAIATSVP